MWLHEGCRANTIETCFKEIGLQLRDSITYFKLDCEHKWEGMCLQLRDQQTCTSNNRKVTKESFITNMVIVDINRRFTNGTQISSP